MIFTDSKIYAQEGVVKETNDSADIAAERLKQSITSLDKAFLNKDSVALAQLLNDAVEVTHSNGWVQDKEDIFEDFRDSTLSYDYIESLKINSIEYRFNTADVKRNVQVKGKFKEYDFDIKLAVDEKWEYENGQWQLWSRKSEKQE